MVDYLEKIMLATSTDDSTTDSAQDLNDSQVLNSCSGDVTGDDVKSCGCAAGSDCEHDSDDGHNHNHDMIERFSLQLGERSEGDIIAAGAETGQHMGLTESSGDQGTVETPPSTGSDAAGGNLGFVLNNTGGAAVGTQAYAAFEQAADLWAYLLGDTINITLDIGFSTLGPGILGSAGSTTAIVSYSALKDALAADATSAEDATAVANLPEGNSLSFEYQNVNGVQVTDNNGSGNNSFLAIKTANAKALGITTDANGSAINPSSDASITFSTSFTWDFDPSDGINAGAQDFVGVAFHEIGHALGFTSGVDLVDIYHGSGPGGPLNLDPYAVFNTLDLFRYDSPDQLDFGYGGTSYFSLDGGTTNLATFSTGRNQGDGQQASHWKDGLGIGIMDPTANPSGNANNPTNLDLLALDVIGYDRLVDNVFFDDEFGGTTSGSNLRDLIMGYAGNDTLNGLSGDDRLLGDTGNDVLNGGLGDDIVDGGEGNDTVVADHADGNDTYSGGAGFDILDFSNVSGSVQINQVAGTITGSAGNDTLLDVFEQIIGSEFDDALSGGNGGDVLDGNGGNDRFFANGGTDLVRGGEGNDRIIHSNNDGNDRLMGGAGFDILDYSNVTGAVQVNQLAGTTTGTSNNDMLLDVFEQVIGTAFADVLSGGHGVNSLIGGAGNDQIFANNGNDYTSGGDGNDTITMGIGNDRHDFRNGEDIDTITDFVAGAGTDDQIVLTFHSAATSFAQMQSDGLFSQVGLDTHIDFGSGDRIVLQNIMVADLHEDDFIF